MPTTDIAVWVAPDMPTTWRDGLTRAVPRLAWSIVATKYGLIGHAIAATGAAVALAVIAIAIHIVTG